MGSFSLSRPTLRSIKWPSNSTRFLRDLPIRLSFQIINTSPALSWPSSSYRMQPTPLSSRWPRPGKCVRTTRAYGHPTASQGFGRACSRGHQLNSSVFFLFVMLFAVGYGLLKIGGWAEKFLHLYQRIDDALSMEKTVIRLEQLTELI